MLAFVIHYREHFQDDLNVVTYSASQPLANLFQLLRYILEKRRKKKDTVAIIEFV